MSLFKAGSRNFAARTLIFWIFYSSIDSFQELLLTFFDPTLYLYARRPQRRGVCATLLWATVEFFENLPRLLGKLLSF